MSEASAEGRLRLATRGSPQARTQTEAVAARLRAAYPGLEVELILVDTTGDRRTDVPLHLIGGQGVFVKEVQQALLDGRADLAVHSAKDLPSGPTPGLVIGALAERRDPRDALVGATLERLAPGATIATGSVRRRAQLAALRPDLAFTELRGNIHTRLGKVPDGGAIVMAVAALQVLGLLDELSASTPVDVVPVDVMVPQVGQGAVAVECRADDTVARERLTAVEHAPTRVAVECERAFLAELGSGCSLPVGAHAVLEGDRVVLRAFLAGADGIYHGTHEGERGESGWAAEAAPAGPPGRRRVNPPGAARRVLSGRTVVITRAATDVGRLRSLLEARGAAVLEVPTIAIADPPDGGAALRAALAARWDWVVVTSVNGAARAVAAAGGHEHRWAVVGPGTAEALEGLGVSPDLVPERFVAESLVEAFPPPPAGRPGRVLLAQAESARPVLADGLRARGWDVASVAAYRTLPVTPPEALLRSASSADAIAFTSGSTVEGFVAAAGVASVPAVVVVIGPITAAAAERHGLAVDAVADPHSLEGLVAATVAVLG